MGVGACTEMKRRNDGRGLKDRIEAEGVMSASPRCWCRSFRVARSGKSSGHCSNRA
jgi:hypothetical protein